MSTTPNTYGDKVHTPVADYNDDTALRLDVSAPAPRTRRMTARPPCPWTRTAARWSSSSSGT